MNNFRVGDFVKLQEPLIILDNKNTYGYGIIAQKNKLGCWVEWGLGSPDPIDGNRKPIQLYHTYDELLPYSLPLVGNILQGILDE